MKIVTLTLANDEVCICSRCKREGRANPYSLMIDAVRKTWASQAVDGVKNYYIYGHRNGIEFPKDSPTVETYERYWPDGGAGDGHKPVDVYEKRKVFAIGDCIYSDTPEGRENLYYKTVDGFEWLVENEEFDYLIRPCGGCYIDLEVHKKWLEVFGKNKRFYAGSPAHYNNSHSKNQPSTVKYGSGSGFIASRDLVEELVKNRNNIDPVRSPYASATISDDVTFGKYWINDMGVDLTAFNKFQFSHVHEITPTVKHYMQCYFRHTINPEMHYAVHRAKGLKVQD